MPIHRPVFACGCRVFTDVERGHDQTSQGDVGIPSGASPKEGWNLVLLCDYRRLNAVTQKDTYPFPHMDDDLQLPRGAGYFATLDLASGYWQVDVADQD